MTEVPEHLLNRSRERRAALGLGGGDAGGGGAAPAAAPTAAAKPAAAVEKAASTAPAAAAAAAAPVPAKVAPPPPPYVQAAIKREKKKIPFWAMAVLAALPLWALLYQYSLTPPTKKLEGPLAVGASVFTQCAGCHGATGGGGVGPQLSGGEVLKTFPSIDDQIAFVKQGSGVIKGQPYGDPARPGGQRVAATGGMPAWGTTLTADQILGVVCHERITLSGEDIAKEPKCQASTGK